jgi:hypothetical protein
LFLALNKVFEFAAAFFMGRWCQVYRIGHRDWQSELPPVGVRELQEKRPQSDGSEESRAATLHAADVH